MNAANHRVRGRRAVRIGKLVKDVAGGAGVGGGEAVRVNAARVRPPRMGS
jgi:hypothetical protein